MLLYDLPGGCSLRLFDEADAQELFALIDRNRDHLRPWLPWVDATRDAVSTLEFIRATRRQADANDGIQTAIVEDGAIIGVAGFHRVDWLNRTTSIGYWLSADRAGRGTMTEAVGMLVDVAFGPWDLNRVELQAALGNHRSRAVAERLGFREEGVRRQAERHGDRYLDLVLYAMLASDWR
ncbi:MAG: ribosomal-protein-serine acetyltransferase [Solirubrobacteraceae bacterium]|nr:ribosomal-protein-serine acetyltransferase [Solirubrobacteraceae bacterium]